MSVVAKSTLREFVLKKRYFIRCLSVCMIFTVSTAFGAAVPAEVKATNTDACMKLAGIVDKYAPTDKSKLPVYCGCVSENYWSGVPQSEYDGMAAEYQSGKVDGPHAKSLNDNAERRLQAAEKKCSGK